MHLSFSLRWATREPGSQQAKQESAGVCVCGGEEMESCNPAPSVSQSHTCRA